MTAKIVEVLAKILEGINLHQSTLDEINKILSKDNTIDKQTVSAAFSLIFDKVLVKKFTDRNRENHDNKKFRILTEEEVMFLGEENRDYIMYLMNVGLVNPSEVDMILEQIFLYPGETITREDINWIVFVSIVDFDSDILPGSRVLLHSNDTIN